MVDFFCGTIDYLLFKNEEISGVYDIHAHHQALLFYFLALATIK